MNLSPRGRSTSEKPAKILKTKEHCDVLTQLHNGELSIESAVRKEQSCAEGTNEKWGALPHVTLVKIFSYLEEAQRLRVQFVCKQWYDVIRHSPSLWRAKSFRFSGRDPRDLTHTPYRYATHFVRTFGKYFQYVEFKLYSPISSGVCKKFQKSVKVCLNHLVNSKAKLKELSIPLLQMDRAQWMVHREDMCAALGKFFCKGQHTLEEVYFRGARARFDDGYKILYAMGYNTGATISVLDLEDFFASGQPVFDLSQFIDCMKYYTNLREVDLNYSYISEELLEALARSLQPNALKKMYVKVYAHDPHNQVIWGHSWTALANHCPELEVSMLFQRVMTFEEHFRILCPQVPLTQVTFDGCYFADQDWQIGPTIASILPHFKEKLKKISIDLPDTREVFENELLNLTQYCPHLTHIKINAFVSPRFLDRLLEMKKQRKCNVTIIKVRLFVRDYDTSQEEQDLERIQSKYKKLINDEMEEYYASCSVSI